MKVFTMNPTIAKKLRKLQKSRLVWESEAYDQYKEFIKYLNFGHYLAQQGEWHQVMNHLIMATKASMELTTGDSQDECLPDKLRSLIADDADEKLTKYVARTVDVFLGKLEER